jgi:hypothetical protein
LGEHAPDAKPVAATAFAMPAPSGAFAEMAAEALGGPQASAPAALMS